MSNFKKILYLSLANILFLFFIEIIFTVFFVFHATNYYGPLARIFLNEKRLQKKLFCIASSLAKKLECMFQVNITLIKLITV